MSLHASTERFRPVSVPVSLFLLVAAAVLFVPPLVLGEVTVRTYAITAAVFILAVSSAFPYAVVVAIGTLPLLYVGLGSYASPAVLPEPGQSPTLTAVLRHVVAGLGYVLAAAVVGAIGFGADFAVPSGDASAAMPSLSVVGGLLVAGTFVGLQLWRDDASLDRRTTAATVVLGGLLAPAPTVALWVFEGGVV